MNKRAWINILFLAIATTTGPAYAEDALACETQSVNFKKREYRCPLTANGLSLIHISEPTRPY